ncbi:MAG: CBS domain-containing protein [Nitrospirota bacterium]
MDTTLPDQQGGLLTTVHTAPRDISVRDVARLMTARGVGAVVVVDGPSPVGIVTDRDIVVRVTAAGLDPAYVLVGAIMSAPLVTVPESESVEAAIVVMGRHGVRRLPIVDEAGHLLSILTLGDLLRLNLARAEDLAPIIKERATPLAPSPDVRPEPREAPLPQPPAPQPANVPPPTLSGPVVSAVRPSVVIPMVKRRRRRSMLATMRRWTSPR